MVNIEIKPSDVPFVLLEFLKIVGKKNTKNNPISKKHRFYKLFKFYWENRDKKQITLPENLFESFNEVLSIVTLKITLPKGKPIRMFLDKNMIDSLCIEAVVVMEYLKRGYAVQWLSPIAKDPPDLRVTDKVGSFEVDFEVKFRNESPTTEGAFRLVAKGLKSLQGRKTKENPAVIVVHNSENLGWADWLEDPIVKEKLSTLLGKKKYRIISGLIFLGGIEIRKDAYSKQIGIQLVGYRVDTATKPLPYSFLLKGSKI